MLFCNFHELFSVWGTVVGAVVCLVENNVPCILQFSSGRVFEPDVPVGGGEAEEYTGGGVVRIEFCTADARLFDGDVGAEHPDVGEVRASTGVGLERGYTTWKCAVGETVLYVDCVADGVTPVVRR